MSSTRGEAIRDRISDVYEKTEGYLLYDMTEATGLELDSMDATLTEVQNQFDVDNITGDNLTKFVYQRKGISRKTAGYATGTVKVTGTGTVEVGDLFETGEGGVQFACTEETDIDEEGTVPVIAVVGGASGNVGAGAIDDMPVTIPGINTCTNEEATTGGYDGEDDDTLRDRYYEAIQTPASNGNKASYKAWARSVTGVGDAKVFPLGHGTGTVDVVIISEAKTAASDSVVADVQNYIDPDSTGTGEGVAPIGATCYVSSATELEINVSATLTIKSSASQSEVQAGVETAVTDYLADIAFDSSIVSAAQIGNVILDVDGVQDYEDLKLNDQSGNVSVEDRQVAVLGEVTLTYA